MNFVLVHLGDKIPNHFKYCIKQILYTNPNSDIYIITNMDILVDNFRINIINTKDLIIPDIGGYYQNDPMSALFRNAMLRIFYINEFMNKHNMENVIHFDNDVLIYEEMDNFKDQLNKFNFLITPSNDKDYTFGFSYFKNNQKLNIVAEKLKELVLQGEAKLEQDLKTMPHEMRLLKYVNEINNFSIIDLFPILPEGLHSTNYNLFNMCFDPLPYGQFLGGLAPEPHHYIGQNVINGTVKIGFKNKKPYGLYNNKEYKIANLHVWGKQLNNFISYE